MRAIIQRVSQAQVAIAGEVTGAIDRGLLALIGFEDADGQADIDWMVGKIVRLRIFPDDQGLMNRSVADITGGILVVSQFTLFASYQKGNRPSFMRAARPETAIPLYDGFVQHLQAGLGRPIATGRFGADMQVQLINDGPVTMMLDSRDPE
jgi:D-tyrosyl-tRNA(Tyr) deacylase